MQVVNSWRDLEKFGIYALTMESCALAYRILFDVDARGAAVIRKAFGIPGMTFAEPWNRGEPGKEHIGSIMLPQSALEHIGLFAVLEHGCKEAHILGGSVIGIEPDDPPDTADLMRRARHVEHSRRFSYRGTAGDRNVHQASGRIE